MRFARVVRIGYWSLLLAGSAAAAGWSTFVLGPRLHALSEKLAVSRSHGGHSGLLSVGSDLLASDFLLGMIWLSLFGVTALALRCSLLPPWLPTYLFCRHGLRTPVSVGDAKILRETFQGRDEVWSARLGLAELPERHRLAALRRAANEASEDILCPMPFPMSPRHMGKAKTELTQAELHAAAMADVHRMMKEAELRSRAQDQELSEQRERMYREVEAVMRQRRGMADAVHLSALDLTTLPQSRAELKAAYRAAVMRCHPDRFHGEREEVQALANDALRRVQAAYEALLSMMSDEQGRT